MGAFAITGAWCTGHVYRQTLSNGFVWFLRIICKPDEAFLNECQLRFFRGYFLERQRQPKVVLKMTIRLPSEKYFPLNSILACQYSAIRTEILRFDCIFTSTFTHALVMLALSFDGFRFQPYGNSWRSHYQLQFDEEEFLALQIVTAVEEPTPAMHCVSRSNAVCLETTKR